MGLFLALECGFDNFLPWNLENLIAYTNTTNEKFSFVQFFKTRVKLVDSRNISHPLNFLELSGEVSIIVSHSVGPSGLKK